MRRASRGRIRAALFAACLGLLAGALARGAEAQTSASDPGLEQRRKAEAHYKGALEFVAEQDYDAAAKEFRAAYDTLPHFEVLHDLGQAYVILGRPLDAIDAFSRYLEQGGPAISAAARKDVEQEIARQLAKTGTLTISTSPSSALVQVDGIELDATARRSPIRQLPGKHVVSASAPGYAPKVSVVDVVVGRNIPVAIALELDSTGAATTTLTELEVTCPVPGVNVVIDGHVSAKTPLTSPLSLPVGRYVIVFERLGYRRVQQPVRLSPGRRSSVDCGAEPLRSLSPALTARLVLNVSEPDARVEVDGRPVSRSSQVPFGPHDVLVTRAGFEPWRRRVTAAATKTTAIDVRLVPTADHARSHRARAQMSRTFGYALAGSGVALGLASLAVHLENSARFSDWQKTQRTLDSEWTEHAGTPAAATVKGKQDANDETGRSIIARDRTVWLLAAGGGALLGAGAALLYFSDSPDRYAPLTIGIEGDGASLGWRESF